MKKSKIVVLEEGMKKNEMESIVGGACDSFFCDDNYSVGWCASIYRNCSMGYTYCDSEALETCFDSFNIVIPID